MAYRMVNSKFWSDNWIVNDLNALDRYLFLYLLTNERRNIIGIYEMPLRVAAFETGIDQADLTKMLVRLQPKVEYVQDGWVYIRNAAEHQADNYNINKGMAREVAALPAAVREDVRVLGIESIRLAAAYDALDDAVAEAALAAEKEQKTDMAPSDSKPLQATSSHLDTASSHMQVARVTKPNLTKPNLTNNKTSQALAARDLQLRKDIKEVFDFYIKSFNAENSHIKLSDKRRTHIKLRLQDAGKEMLFQAITNTANSPFHRGDNDRGWKANIDFIIRSYEQVEKLAALDEITPIADTKRPPTDEEINRAMESF